MTHMHKEGVTVGRKEHNNTMKSPMETTVLTVGLISSFFCPRAIVVHAGHFLLLERWKDNIFAKRASLFR